MSAVENINSDLRTKAVKLQIILSFVFRGLGIGLNFFVIPVTLSLLSTDKYGIWITLQSVFSWITLFDIGIGNGLRNKLAIALSQKDMLNAKKYISTGYFIIALIGFFLIIILLVGVNLVNWRVIFKSDLLTNKEYQRLILISISSLILCFVLGLINQILSAFQKNSYTNLISIMSNSMFIALIFAFRQSFQSDLISVATCYFLCLIISYILITLGFFIYNRSVLPGIKYIELEKIADILKLGGSFFIVQIAVLLIFSIDNFLILQLLGPSAVAQYNIVYRVFSIFTIGFGIIMGPLWSAFTEANEKNDVVWIKNIIRKLHLALVPLVISLVIVSIFFNRLLILWLPRDKSFNTQTLLIVCMAFFVLVSIWNNIYASYLNGVSETKVQVRTAVIGALINIPLAIVFVKYVHLGLSGVILSMISSLIIFSVVGPIITYKKLNYS
jgi:O-antigen/teichoic acid export membrane protein